MSKTVETDYEDTKECGNCKHFYLCGGISGLCTLKPASLLSSIDYTRDDKGRVVREERRYTQPVMHVTASCSRWKRKKEKAF